MAIYKNFVLPMVQNYLTGKKVKAALLGPGYVQDISGHTVYSHVQPFELPASTGYTPGGVVVTIDVDWSDIELGVLLDCPPISFGALHGAEVSCVAFYADTGSASSSPLLVADVLELPMEIDSSEFVYETPDGGLTALLVTSEVFQLEPDDDEGEE